MVTQIAYDGTSGETIISAGRENLIEQCITIIIHTSGFTDTLYKTCRNYRIHKITRTGFTQREQIEI
jgi:hypothetical protein